MNEKNAQLRPFFSVIIPAYNCKDTIGRLLESLTQQNLSKDELEVIICDDNSTDNFIDSIDVNIFDVLNIIYCKTDVQIHCPGNTRKSALPYASGEWITFIDNDDIFEPDVFNTVRQYIINTKEKNIVCTNFREFIMETNSYGREFIGEKSDTWLHGTFYNKDNLLDKFAIDFKQDLYSHEDVYFNSCILANLIGRELDYNYMDLFTYKWVANPNSLSRSFFNEKHFYIEVYLKDYITACTEPFIEANKLYGTDNHDASRFYFHQVMMGLLHVYFYFEGSKYRLGDEIIAENLTYIHNMKQNIKENFSVDNGYIINYIYSNPILFNNIRKDSVTGVGNFIESESFKDFILKY